MSIFPHLFQVPHDWQAGVCYFCGYQTKTWLAAKVGVMIPVHSGCWRLYVGTSLKPPPLIEKPKSEETPQI